MNPTPEVENPLMHALIEGTGRVEAPSPIAAALIQTAVAPKEEMRAVVANPIAEEVLVEARDLNLGVVALNPDPANPLNPIRIGRN